MCIYFKLIGTEHTGPLFPCMYQLFGLGSYRIKTERKKKRKNYLAIRIQSKIPINLML